MQKYLQKMIEEQKELKFKIVKCEKIIANPPYDIDEKGLNLLQVQLGFMRKYSEVLQQRIDYEGGKNE